MKYNNSNIRIILSTISTYLLILQSYYDYDCCYIIIRHIYHIGVHIIIMNIERSRTAAAVVSHCSGCALCASPIDPNNLFIIIITIIYLHLHISLVCTCILIYYVPLYAIVFGQFPCSRIM